MVIKPWLQFSEVYGEVDHVAKYVDMPCVLCMDRLSSHVSKRVITYAESLKCSDGVTQKFKILLLTPKAAFLISPLDMGFFTMFKRAYYKCERSTYALKIMAANQVWKTISSDKIVNLFNNCGITSKESPKSLHNRIAAQVRSGIPEELEEVWEFYQGWLGGAFDISGATRPRAPPTEHLIVPNDSDLNGQYWIKRGPKCTISNGSVSVKIKVLNSKIRSPHLIPAKLYNKY